MSLETLLRDRKSPVQTDKKSQTMHRRRKSNLIHSRPSIDGKDLPPSYSTNTSKEELILQYVLNFNQQFQHVYSDRIVPFMIAENETGLKKMVCSYVRPTCTKYEELNAWKNCAEFVADYFLYEPLISPTEEPKSIFSPTMLMRSRQAHCFEMSCYLCSMLIGLGYDAYVVNGYATQDVCLVNLERADWILEKKVKVEEIGKNVEALIPKYTMEPLKVEVESSFDNKMEHRQVVAERTEIAKQQAIELAILKEEQRPPVDRLYGQRVHSWLLVKSGRMEVAENFFIEPTTGRLIFLNDEKYLGIESLWNHVNFWVNMQPCINGVEGMVYNFKDEGLWECFLPYQQIELTLDTSIPDERSEDAPSSNIDQEMYDMPQSWIAPIEILPKDLHNRLPRGKKVELYKYYKVDKFDPYSMKDGLIQRISKYKTWDRHVLLTVEDRFQRRADKMHRRLQDYSLELVTEYFQPGQRNALKEHRYKMNDVSLESERTLTFYQESRVDGLAKREYFESELIDYYANRFDFLKYRRAVFSPRIKEFGSPDTPRRSIESVHEKYDPDPSKSAKEDVAEVLYKASEGKIKIVYQTLADRIAPSWREFARPEAQDYNKVFDLNCMKEYQANPQDPRLTKLEACMLFQEYRKKELLIMSKVRQSETELQTLLNERFKEEAGASLYVSPYDTVHNENNRKLRMQQEKEELEEKQNEDKEQDYLLLYFLQLDISPTASLTHKQVNLLTDVCLSDCKKQLMDKYNLLSKSYEKEVLKLKQQQAWYEKNQATLTTAEEHEHNTKCQDIKLKIQIAEQRIAQHRENAPLKYLALERKLKNDPRFSLF